MKDCLCRKANAMLTAEIMLNFSTFRKGLFNVDIKPSELLIPAWRSIRNKTFSHRQKDKVMSSFRKADGKRGNCREKQENRTFFKTGKNKRSKKFQKIFYINSLLLRKIHQNLSKTNKSHTPSGNPLQL